MIRKLTTLGRLGITMLLFVLLLFGGMVASVQQLRADDPPACDTLPCWEQEDCGSKCFCNRPLARCYVD
jgi:hypothetical protein